MDTASVQTKQIPGHAQTTDLSYNAAPNRILATTALTIQRHSSVTLIGAPIHAATFDVSTPGQTHIYQS
jgi:hypothetical protein